MAYNKKDNKFLEKFSKYRYCFKESYFIHIPRTGGTASKKVFREMSLRNGHSDHLTYLQSKEKILQHVDNIVTFTIIRNPLERIVSSYCSPNFPNCDSGKLLQQVLNIKHQREISFDEFVLNLQLIEDNAKQTYFNQGILFNSYNSYDLLKDEEDKINIDYMLYNKNLENDIVKFINELKLCDKEFTLEDISFMPKKGYNSTVKDKNWKDFYDDELLKVAMKYYEKDFDYFDL